MYRTRVDSRSLFHVCFIPLIMMAIVSLPGCGRGGSSSAEAPPTIKPPPTTDPPPSNDPTKSAPPLPATTSINYLDATQFLYTGTNPIQTGVAAGTIQLKRVAVLRGRLLDKDAKGLADVKITVLDHPEYGQTLTRHDGQFDLAVNGGGALTVSLTKAGYLPAQRTIDTPWQDYVVVPDVVLLALDPAVSKIDVGATNMQIARGSETSDADGTRQATIVVPPATTATMIMPDGTQKPLEALDMRVTEYTVGDNGRKAMPAELPPNSGYTYAAELSVDQAVAAGAQEVKFNQALPVYVDNFLGFPVGWPVPVGYYDKQKGQWVAQDSGVIIKIVSIDAGIANVDVDGDDVVDTGDALANIGMTTEEQQKLATLYTAGKSLWRFAVKHFSSWDCNWGFGPPPDAIGPNVNVNNPNVTPNKRCGSIIGCEAQTLGEVIPLTGSPLRLHYNSEQVSQTDNVLEIPVTGDSVPPSIKRIDLEVVVAGKVTSRTYSAAPNLSYRYVFNGKDAYGRDVNGRQKVNVTISYVYGAYYQRTARFGYNGNGENFVADRTRAEFSFSTHFETNVGGLRNRALNAAGWSISAHHVYDPGSGELLQGNGERRGANLTAIYTAAGTGTRLQGAYDNETGPALSTNIGQVADVAAGSDGSIYINDLRAKIKRVGLDGNIRIYAGRLYSGSDNIGDGGPATSADISPLGMAGGPDGNLYFVDNQHWRVRKINRQGIITTVAGNGTLTEHGPSSGDGGPATSAGLHYPTDVAVAKDGTIYVAERNRIRRVGTDGIITTIVGTGTNGNSCGVGAPATTNVSPSKLAVGRDGSIYFLATGTGMYSVAVCKMAPDGMISVITGRTTDNPNANDVSLADGSNAQNTFWGYDGYSTLSIADIAVSYDGSVLLVTNELARIFSIDVLGKLTRIAGSSLYPYISTYKNAAHGGYSGDGGPAADAKLWVPSTLATGADGSLIIGDTANNRVRAIRSYQPVEVDTGTVSDQPRFFSASADGSEVYGFDATGRHLVTREALTGAVRYTFSYNEDGYLKAITDGDGNATRIERNANVPVAIIAPGGQRTTLTMQGALLMTVGDPMSNAHAMTYHANGLLATFTPPARGTYRLEYDTNGYLTKDSDPDGGSVTLARTILANGYRVTATTELGRVYTYQIETLDSGEVRSTLTDPAGAITRRSLFKSGTEVLTYPNNSVVRFEYTPDPRWGLSARYARAIEARRASGPTRSLTVLRGITLTNAMDPWSLATLEETTTENNIGRSKKYTAEDKTLKITSRTGRVFSVKLNAQGRVERYSAATGVVDDVVRDFDTKGRLHRVVQGDFAIIYDYDSASRLASVKINDASPTRYEYNNADRVTRLILPSERDYLFGYDAQGRVTQITMPNRKIHSLGYTETGRDRSYTPPQSADELSWGYDKDGAWNLTTLLDGSVLTAGYDDFGRPNARAYGDMNVTYGYNDVTARIHEITKTRTAQTAQKITLDYDAELVSAMQWSGIAVGQFNYLYDTRTLLSNISVDGGAANIAIARDDDGLVTVSGPFTFRRTGPAGAVDRISDTTSALALGYDTRGRLNRRGLTVNNVALFDVAVHYDAAGRLTQRVETANSGTRTLDYYYDADGQLDHVKVGDATIEQYHYDSNGNRDTANGVASTYDAQDRLKMRGSVNYTFDTRGYLKNRGLDTFTYSARGELLSATVGTNTVAYFYDGLGRMVGRKLGNGTTEQYLYGNPDNPLQLTAARSSGGVLSVYHYDQLGNVIALQQGGDYYYVATDDIGTPRMISDASGVIVKTLSYNSFGELSADSAPTFYFPIGYAGGLYDPVTRFVRFGYRDYDTEAGRWTARDPAMYDGMQLNLYSYADNNPLGRRDASGLFTLGGSAYGGVGGGIKLTIDSTGFKICGEIGFGIGASVELDPLEKVGNTDLTPSIIGEVSLGPVGAGLELTQEGDCFSLNPSFKLGPVKGKFNGITTADPSGFEFTNFELPLKAEAKIAGMECGGMKF